MIGQGPRREAFIGLEGKKGSGLGRKEPRDASSLQLLKSQNQLSSLVAIVETKQRTFAFIALRRVSQLSPLDPFDHESVNQL